MARRQNWLHRCAPYTTEPHSRQTRGRRWRSFIGSGAESRLNTKATLRNQDANREKAGRTSFSPFGSVIKLALSESGESILRTGRPRATAVDQQRTMSTTDPNTSTTDDAEICIANGDSSTRPSNGRHLETVPTCPACGTMLPNTSRWRTERGKWECPGCRRICGPEEVGL